MIDRTFYFNGLSYQDSYYHFPTLSLEQVAKVTRSETEDKGTAPHGQPDADLSLRFLPGLYDDITESPMQLSVRGWAVIFPWVSPTDRVGLLRWEAIREQLAPLLQRRKTQAQARYFEFFGQDGLLPQETIDQLLKRHHERDRGATRFPYYVLLVGDPTDAGISYEFQSHLDANHAVGRLAFDQTTDYGNYASSVVAHELSQSADPLSVTLFGPKNPSDQATRLSHDLLLTPLLSWLRGQGATQPDLPAFSTRAYLENDATKTKLLAVLNQKARPGLCLFAGHGLAFRYDPVLSDLQQKRQGALICQDWPGSATEGVMPTDWYVSAEDVAVTSDLSGQILILFACYSGGTPKLNQYFRLEFRQNANQIAAFPFVAPLPKRLLSLPKGGALACIAQVERSFGSSFLSYESGSVQRGDFGPYRSLLERLLLCLPVGFAIEHINRLALSYASQLVDMIDPDQDVESVSEFDRVWKWTVMKDVRNFSILGDPFVRLRDSKRSDVSLELLNADNVVRSPFLS